MILALDLATSTGWCAGAGDASPAYGSVTMPDTKEEVGPFLDFFDRWLHRKITEVLEEAGVVTAVGDYGTYPTDAKVYLIFEAPVLPRARLDNRGHLVQAPTTIATTRKLQGLAGVTEMVGVRRHLEVREVHLQTVKKELSGSGRGEKPDMIRAAKRCGLNPKNSDEADAFGVWLVGVRHYAKQFQHTWDQRLWGGRGAML